MSLFRAARNGHTDIVRLLIENGANVNKGGVRYRDKLNMVYRVKSEFKFHFNLYQNGVVLKADSTINP